MGRAILNKHQGKKNSKAAILMAQIRNSDQREVKIQHKTVMLTNGFKTQLKPLNKYYIKYKNKIQKT